MDGVTFRAGRVRDLPRVLDTYRTCFGHEACLRTVAHTGPLFLAYYGALTATSRCKVALAERAGRVVGLCMVRRVASASTTPLWLCTALCVRPEARGTGAARRLFEMVQDRPLVGSVEEDGPLAMYDRLGWTRTGWQTLVYFDRESVDQLGRLPSPGAGEGEQAKARALNHRAFLILADRVDGGVITMARRRLRVFRTGVLQLPGRVRVPDDASFPTVVHEVVFHRPWSGPRDAQDRLAAPRAASTSRGR